MRLLRVLGATPSTLLLILSSLQVIRALERPNGLKIETTTPGPICSRKTKNGDVLSMQYRGTLESDGSEFDSNVGGSPFSFRLGQGEVIRGWDQGLVGACIGEERKLTIPAALGYGSRGAGSSIPPNSVLIFETKVLGIQGVKEEPLVEPIVANSTTPGSDINAAIEGSEKGPKHKEDDGECKLLGKFAILVQTALGLLALLALVWKRWREQPRRPVKVWWFDVSKQVFGSIMVHFANLFLSMLSSGHLELTASALAATDGEDHVNPCSFYLLNLAIDTTIGIPILVFSLRILHALFLYTPLANPPESLKSGNYGSPPKAVWWLKQALIYFLGLLIMKLLVFLLFQLFPWLGWVGDWALRWTEGKAWVQITFVMLIFPLIMNAAQYWIIDSFIKDTSSTTDYNAIDEDGDDDDSDNEGLIERQSLDDSDGIPTIGKDGKIWGKGGIKEANPLPLPIEFERDDENVIDIKPGSSASTS